MSQILVCDGTWLFPSSGSPTCSGGYSALDAGSIPSGITLEDAQELTGHAILLFAVVFGVLAVKKVLTH